jgi:hypothetical protein
MKSDPKDHRETAVAGSARDSAALASFERLAGKLRCDRCGSLATTIRVERRGARNTFSGTCPDHTPKTIADRRVQVALAERAMTREI